MSCSEHTLHLDVDGHALKLDTRRMHVELDGAELRRDEALHQALLRHGAQDATAAQLCVTPRRGGGAPITLRADGHGGWQATAPHEVYELFAATSFETPRRWLREPLYPTVRAELGAELGHPITDDEALALLRAGVGPRRLRGYLDAGARDLAQVRRCALSGVSAADLEAWTLLAPSATVNTIIERRKHHLSAGRALDLVDVLLERPSGPGSTAERARGLLESLATSRTGQLPFARLWEGAAPVVPFLHEIGVSPTMLARAIAEERSVAGQGSYFSKLSRALRGDPDVTFQLLDYTLQPYQSSPTDDVQFRVDDRSLLQRARGHLQHDTGLRAALRAAIDETVGPTPLLTTGAALGVGLAATAFSNGYTMAAGLWAHEVRHGTTGHGERALRWQDIKEATTQVLRERSCPQLAAQFGSQGTQMAFVAASSEHAHRSAAQTQALRHVYLLHPHDRCTELCARLRGGAVPTIALQSQYTELVHQYQAAVEEPRVRCRHCFAMVRPDHIVTPDGWCSACA